mgnify:CR=1 FL=1
MAVPRHAGPGGGEHVPGDGRVGPRAEQLRSAVQELPPARRHPDPCGGVDVPEKSHGAQHVLVGNGLHPLIGRARDGPQEVQRDGADLQLCQADRQVQAVLPALSHAQYAAGAHLQPRRPGPLDVGHLVLIGVCGAHLWEVSPGGLQIGVAALHPRLLHAPELLLGLEAVGGAQLQPALPMQPGVGLQGLLQLHPLQAAPGGDDREAVDAPRLVPSALRHDLLQGEEGILLHLGAVVAGLGAELAVLAAPAAPAVDDGAQVRPVPAQGLPDLVRSRPQLLQVRRQEDGQVVPAVQPSA